MSKNPSGILRGNELVITRSFKAPIADVWTSVTKSESTERWFGKWEGEGKVGNTIRLKMVFEKGDAWISVTINKCDAPNHLDLTSKSDYGESHYEIKLREDNGTTLLEFVHHLKDRKGVQDLGPGWEYYFDMLVASREGKPTPLVWEDYYPSQKAYYAALAETAE